MDRAYHGRKAGPILTNLIDISPSSVSNPRAFHKSLINNVKISRVLDPWTKTKDPVSHIEIPQ